MESIFSVCENEIPKAMNMGAYPPCPLSIEWSIFVWGQLGLSCAAEVTRFSHNDILKWKVLSGWYEGLVGSDAYTDDPHVRQWNRLEIATITCNCRCFKVKFSWYSSYMHSVCNKLYYIRCFWCICFSIHGLGSHPICIQFIRSYPILGVLLVHIFQYIE